MGKHNEHHLKAVLALKHRTCDRVDTTFVILCSEKALPKLLLDIEVFGKQQIAGAVRVRELLKVWCKPGWVKNYLNVTF